VLGREAVPVSWVLEEQVWALHAVLTISNSSGNKTKLLLLKLSYLCNGITAFQQSPSRTQQISGGSAFPVRRN